VKDRRGKEPGDERRDTRHAGRPPSLGTVSLAGPFSSVTSRLTPPSLRAGGLRLMEGGVSKAGRYDRKGPKRDTVQTKS